MPANNPVCFLSWSCLSICMHAGHLIHRMTTLWATPQTLTPNQLRSFVIYSRYYIALLEAWYQLDAVPKEDIGSGQVSSTIQTAIEKVVAIVDRQEGLGMKLTKVHCPTHTDYNLTMFGSNQNTNSGPCESWHEEHIKNSINLILSLRSSHQLMIKRQGIGLNSMTQLTLPILHTSIVPPEHSTLRGSYQNSGPKPTRELYGL